MALFLNIVPCKIVVSGKGRSKKRHTLLRVKMRQRECEHFTWVVFPVQSKGFRSYAQIYRISERLIFQYMAMPNEKSSQESGMDWDECLSPLLSTPLPLLSIHPFLTFSTRISWIECNIVFLRCSVLKVRMRRMCMMEVKIIVTKK